MRGAHPLRPLDAATCWTPWVAGSALSQFTGLLAAVLLASSALTAALARPVFAQQQETATLHWGGTVVWLRATDEANVLVFASPGYRNAFARPTILSADEADQWATLIERLEAPPTARSTGLRITDSTRAALAGGDLLIEPATSTAGAALRMRLSATRPDGITTMLFPDAAPSAAAALHDAARVARQLHSTVLATANAPPVAPTQLAAAVPAALPQPAAPSMAAAPTTTPSAVATHGPTVRVVAVQATPPPAAAPTTQITGPAGTTTPSAAPVSTVPSAPSAPAAVPTEVAAATPASIPVAAVASVTPAPASPPRLRVARPSFVPPVPLRQATAPAAPVTAPAPASPAVPTTTAHPSVLAAVTIRTNTPRLTQRNGVDNATVMNLVRQWQPDLTYCYTEYGLRNHPGLYGSVLVRMTIAPQGTVSRVVVARRKWSDDGATEVEACVRSRVAAWYFPPAAVLSVHQFPLTFSQ